MPYVGSYTWRMRQKVGSDCLLLPGVGTVCVNEKGEIMMGYSETLKAWAVPTGSVEAGHSWAEAAAQEVLEESALVVEPLDLIPFASVSGKGFVTHYEDGSSQGFALAFFTDKFTVGNTLLDTEEISEARWFSPAELETIDKTPFTARVLPAYQAWLQTKEFQQIVIK